MLFARHIIPLDSDEEVDERAVDDNGRERGQVAGKVYYGGHRADAGMRRTGRKMKRLSLLY